MSVVLQIVWGVWMWVMCVATTFMLIGAIACGSCGERAPWLRRKFFAMVNAWVKALGGV